MDIKSLLFLQLSKQAIPLANQFYKQVYKKGSSKRNDHVFVLRSTQIICAARLKEIKGCLLLTGVACANQYRQLGLASLLIDKLLQMQKTTVYCFPYIHLQHFYEKRGFKLIDAGLLPVQLGLQYQRYNNRQPLLCMVYNHER